MNKPGPLDLLADFDGRPTLVEASAGTGKTYSIAFLTMRMVSELGMPIDEILVVTFTEAATKELRDRIRARLVDARDALQNAQGALDDDVELGRWLKRLDEREDLSRAQALGRLRLALVDYDEAVIATIHGFCRRMLAEHAFESGTSFENELLKNENQLIDLVLADHWIRAHHDAPTDTLRSMEKVLKLSDARTFFIQSLGVAPERILSELDHSRYDSQFMNSASHAHRFKRALALQGRRDLQRLKRESCVLGFRDLLLKMSAAMPDRHSPLAKKVGERFQAVLVDEFQDTDPLQSRILRHAFEGRAYLFFIGDPKQAIYRFRGADIFAYLEAASRFGEGLRTLDRNWRSDPPLIEALNRLFMKPDLAAPFYYEDIAYHEMESGRPDTPSALGPGVAPLRFMWIDRHALDAPRNAKRVVKPVAVAGVAHITANRILQLLEGDTTLHHKPIKAPDIAVLVRTNNQAVAIQDALRQRRIPSVLHNPDPVWRSDEAQELFHVLTAVAHPHDSRLLRRALTTSLFGLRSADILDLESSDHGWDEHAQAFRRWHERWLKRGFIQMFHALLSDARVPSRVLRVAGGERKMTNLLHLAELLHGAAATHDLQLEGLLTLMESRLAEGDDQSGDEAVELRLESDEAAVQILTVHRSKGLEFPIVFCPYLWNGFKKEAKKTHVLYHEPESDWALTMDLGSTSMTRAKALCDEEAFAEELRLAYVALTRAKHACFVVWGHFSTAERSPLAYLLHGSQERLPDRDLAAYVKTSRALNELQLRTELELFVEEHPGLMAFEKVDQRPTTRTLDLPTPMMEIEAARYSRQEDHRWAVSSFSRLRSGEAPRGPQEDGLDHDVSNSHLLEAQASATPIPLVDFPRGSRAGTFFHELLEHLDFQRVWQPESLELVKQTMERFNYDLNAATTVRKALAATVETSLKDGLRLFVVSRTKRIDELEFLLPISAPLRPRTLANVFREHQSVAVDSSYPDRLDALSFPALKGFLKGYIDLIFEHEGRYYLADYKSNHLGDDVEAYRQLELGKTMSHGHYYLQYHLYLLALHRFLGLRKRDYDYERDMGGVFYLFIKGMDPRRGPTHGVFYDKPSLQMIEALSAAFGETPGA